jgi:PAS fold
MRLQRADGEYRWFLVRTAPLRDEHGNVVKWYEYRSTSRTASEWNGNRWR